MVASATTLLEVGASVAGNGAAEGAGDAAVVDAEAGDMDDGIAELTEFNLETINGLLGS